MNRPMRKLIAFSAAAAMLANVPLMGANAKYVAEQVGGKDFASMIQYPDRNIYIESGNAFSFDADQQLVVVGTDGTTKLLSLAEGIEGGISYATTTMGIYDFCILPEAEFGFDFRDPSYRLSIANDVTVVRYGGRTFLCTVGGERVSDGYDEIVLLDTEHFMVRSGEAVGAIGSDGKVLIEPSKEITDIFISSDGKNLLIDGDGKDYMTDISGKTVSPVYEEIQGIINNPDTSRYADQYAWSSGHYEVKQLALPLYRVKKDGRYALTNGGTFEPISKYFTSIDFGHMGLTGSDDTDGNVTFDMNGSVIQTEIKVEYDSEKYDLAKVGYLDENGVFTSLDMWSGTFKGGVETYLLPKTEDGTYDKLADMDGSVLLEGESISTTDFSVIVKNDGKLALYDAKLEKLGEYEKISRDTDNIICLSGDKCTVYDKYLTLITDKAPAAAVNIVSADRYYKSGEGYITLGYSGRDEENVYSFDAEFNLVDTKPISEGQTYIINEKRIIFVYDSSYSSVTTGDNIYLYKSDEDTAKVVDDKGNVLREVPKNMYPAASGGFFTDEDGVICFYDSEGKLLRKFNASYGSKSISAGMGTKTLTTLTDIIINDKGENGGRTTYLYDLTTDTVKYTQTGKYDDIEVAGFDLIRTIIYPDDQSDDTESSPWTYSSGCKFGMIKMDGTELVKPMEDVSLYTEKYCYGACSSPDYRDMAIDLIYNDGLQPQYDSFYGTEEQFANPATDTSDVDGYITIGGDAPERVFIPIRDFAPEYADKYGYTAAVKLRYGTYVVIRDGKWGIADENGKPLSEIKYDEICEFSDGIGWMSVKEEMTLAADSEKYVPSLGRYVQKGEVYTAKVNCFGLISKDGAEIVAPYYDERENIRHYNVEHFLSTYYTYRTIDAADGRYIFGIYRGKDFFNEFAEKYGYDSAEEYGDFYLVSKDGLKGIVTADNEVVVPVEFADIMYVPASERIAMYRLPSDVRSALADPHYSSPISELGDGSKLVNVRTVGGTIRAYQIREVEETTTATTTAPTTTTTTATTSQTTAASSATEQGTATTGTTPAQPANDFGDINDDSRVDAKDASLVLVAYAKVSTGAEDGLTDAQRAAADVNSDGKTDAKDASFILAYYAMVSTASGDVPTLREYMAAKAS
ncbi:MAG: dockerin type I domain-containing protein [Ruminococcus sp.]|nr:dockerin type I domain-containing protein [Ruminococcus sp.]